MAEAPKDILLTGASGAIGTAIARRLSHTGLYRLHLTSRRTARLMPLVRDLSVTGTPAQTYTLDLSKPTQADQVIKTFFKKAPRPYGLICNAGNLGLLGTFLDSDFKKWSQSLTENFVSQARLIQAFARGLHKKHLKEGAVIALGGAGIGGNSTFDHITSYSAAKAALIHLVEALASEWTGNGITINAVSPGQVLSGLTESAIRAGVERAGDYALQAQKCKETGGVSPDLAAQLIEFLLSPAGHAITGRLLSARFDRESVQRETERIARNPNLYRLRRIDDALFMEKPR